MNNYNPLPQKQSQYDDPSEPRKKPKSKKVLVLILILLVLGAVGYISYDKYNDYMNDRYNEVANYAGVIGQQQLLLQIVGIVAKCELFPITIPIEENGETINQTINLMAYECLQGVSEQNG